MSPFDDLSDVAAAGRKTAGDFWMKTLVDPKSAPIPAVDAFRSNIGQGGTFDYQRRASKDDPTGFIQLPQVRNVSNVNVGLFGHQAGLPLEAVLTIAGIYALKNSSNAKPNKPNFFDPTTRQFIELGYKLGQSGAFNSANRPTYNR